MITRPTESREGVKGQLLLAESRGSASVGVWGNAPIISRATSMSNALNKGAGSEASLPVTSRVRRRALKLLFRPTVLCRARWARPRCWAFDHSWSIPQKGISPLRRRKRGFSVSPLPPSGRHPRNLTFSAAENHALQKGLYNTQDCASSGANIFVSKTCFPPEKRAGLRV